MAAKEGMPVDARKTAKKKARGVYQTRRTVQLKKRNGNPWGSDNVGKNETGKRMRLRKHRNHTKDCERRTSTGTHSWGPGASFACKTLGSLAGIVCQKHQARPEEESREGNTERKRAGKDTNGLQKGKDREKKK